MEEIIQATDSHLKSLTEMAMDLWPGHEEEEMKNDLGHLVDSEKNKIYLFIKEGEAVGFVHFSLRSLALTLHQELKAQKIYVGTLTVKGFVKKETYVSPENIAETYYEMYENRDQAEWVFEKK